MPQLTFQISHFKEQQERTFVSSKKQKEKGNPKYFQHFFSFFSKCKSHRNWPVPQKVLSKEVFISTENT